MSHAQETWIRQLQLEPHPEGGWYREVYRSVESIPPAGLPDRFGGQRSFSTAIYYLLASGDFSALHRIQQDEIWHFYDGVPLTIEVIYPDGNHERLRLGRDLAAGERPVAVVPAHCWFGAAVAQPRGYSLVGCTVAPGFEFDDFELSSRDELLEKFPQHRRLIEQFTR